MKRHLLTTSAVLGLVALAAAPAGAFDTNTWEWNKTVDETVTVDVVIDSDIVPTGHIELQDSQIFNGDVVARATIDGNYLSNDAVAPTAEGTVVVPVEIPVETQLNLNGTYDANSTDPNITTANLTAAPDGLQIDSATVDEETSQISVQPSEFNFDIALEGTATGEQEIDLSELGLEGQTLDATTELANGAAEATAVANFKNIQTESATFLTESQLHNALNQNEEFGAGVFAEARAGELEAPVALAVDLDATAVSNLLTMNSNTSDPNNVFIGDVTQETNANVLAEATTVQDLSGFNNLGAYPGIPDADGVSVAGQVANLSATAIGNFADLRIGPSVDLTPDE